MPASSPSVPGCATTGARFWRCFVNAVWMRSWTTSTSIGLVSRTSGLQKKKMCVRYSGDIACVIVPNSVIAPKKSLLFLLAKSRNTRTDVMYNGIGILSLFFTPFYALCLVYLFHNPVFFFWHFAITRFIYTQRIGYEWLRAKKPWLCKAEAQTRVPCARRR